MKTCKCNTWNRFWCPQAKAFEAGEQIEIRPCDDEDLKLAKQEANDVANRFEYPGGMPLNVMAAYHNLISDIRRGDAFGIREQEKS